MEDYWVFSFFIDIENKELSCCERGIVLLKDNGVALWGPGRVEIQEVRITRETCKSVSVRSNHPDLGVGKKTGATATEGVIGVEGNLLAVG
jgi:hypothetical protein